MFADWEEHKLIEDGLIALIGECPRSDIGDLVGYVLSSPGKRVRPLILLFSSKAFGGDPEASLNAAMAVEIVHAASLVHDDILDGGVERRGAPSAVHRYGMEAALLAGDYLISKSIDLISGYSQPVIREFSRACMEMAEGEMLDLSRIASSEDYYHCVSRKTASLFSASARIGCMIAGAGIDEQELLGRYGLRLGLAYQIVDDLEEVCGVDQGKRSMKSSITLPRIHAGRLSHQETLAACADEIKDHACSARSALTASGGAPEMLGRLLLIVDQMTDSLVNECRLPETPC